MVCEGILLWSEASGSPSCSVQNKTLDCPEKGKHPTFELWGRTPFSIIWQRIAKTADPIPLIAKPLICPVGGK